MDFANKELEKAAALAKRHGLKVWTFEKPYGKIEQIFFDDGKTYGTASVDFGGLKYGTCHAPCRECGTGFGLTHTSQSANIEDILRTLAYAPGWAMSKTVKKETFAQHIKRNSILRYCEL